MTYLEYTTLADLKEYLPNTGLEDDELSALITRCSKMLDAELGDNIWEQVVTKKIDGYGKPKLIMENNITEVEYVKYYQSKTWIEINVDRISGPIIFLDSDAPVGDLNIEVKYTKWYADVPEDIQAFFHIYVAKVLDLDKAVKWETQWEVTSKSINGLRVSYKTPSEIVDREMTGDGRFARAFSQILAKYKNFSISVA